MALRRDCWHKRVGVISDRSLALFSGNAGLLVKAEFHGKLFRHNSSEIVESDPALFGVALASLDHHFDELI
jgi:hypothetical protein